MLHEVRVLPREPGSVASRFETERDEPLKVDDVFTQLTMVYKVRRVLPASAEYEVIVEVAQVGGPGQGWYE